MCVCLSRSRGGGPGGGEGDPGGGRGVREGSGVSQKGGQLQKRPPPEAVDGRGRSKAPLLKMFPDAES